MPDPCTLLSKERTIYGMASSHGHQVQAGATGGLRHVGNVKMEEFFVK